MKKNPNEVSILPYVIPKFNPKTTLGIAMQNKFLDELQRHQNNLKKLAGYIYEAAKRQIVQPINYLPQQREKDLLKLIGDVEREKHDRKTPENFRNPTVNIKSAKKLSLFTD